VVTVTFTRHMCSRDRTALHCAFVQLYGKIKYFVLNENELKIRHDPSKYHRLYIASAFFFPLPPPPSRDTRTWRNTHPVCCSLFSPIAPMGWLIDFLYPPRPLHPSAPSTSKLFHSEIKFSISFVRYTLFASALVVSVVISNFYRVTVGIRIIIIISV